MAYPPPLQPNYYGPTSGGQPPPAGLSVASMVCGIASLPLICFWYLSLPLAVVALVLGLVARGQVRRGIAGGGGMALAGIICGSITLGLVLLVVLLGLGLLAAIAGAGAAGHR